MVLTRAQVTRAERAFRKALSEPQEREYQFQRALKQVFHSDGTKRKKKKSGKSMKSLKKVGRRVFNMSSLRAMQSLLKSGIFPRDEYYRKKMGGGPYRGLK